MQYILCHNTFKLLFHAYSNRCDSEQLVREMERLSKEHTELQSHYFRYKKNLKMRILREVIDTMN